MSKHPIRDLFAQRLHEQIEKSSKSITVIAELAGMSRMHIYRLMRAEASPSIDNVAHLAEALDCEFHDLLR